MARRRIGRHAADPTRRRRRASSTGPEARIWRRDAEIASHQCPEWRLPTGAHTRGACPCFDAPAPACPATGAEATIASAMAQSTRQEATETLPTRTRAQFAAAVRRAASLLRAGELVALPTETVYGVAADARSAGAVRRIFAAKGRPAHNPIIVHVDGVEMARTCVVEWPPAAAYLARAFWPGPLTLVLRRSSLIPDIVTAGGDTVGVRCPSHRVIQAVIRACGFPLAAPSANRSAEVSPTTAEHVYTALAGRIPCIVDGGPCPVGIESTVLDLTVSPPRVLRPGMVHEESLRAVVGRLARGRTGGGPVRKSPGSLERHYAPRARLVVARWKRPAELASVLKESGAVPARTWVLAHRVVPEARLVSRVSVLPHDAAAFGSVLYAALHRCDEAGAGWIVVEAVPEKAEWRGIADRLRRAAAR